MSTKYEYYDNTHNQLEGIYDEYWMAQTFTPEVSHSLTKVKLLLQRLGSPGTVTIYIKETVDGHPTGGLLATGTTDGDTLPSGSSEWREIILDSPCNVNADTKYGIVVKVLGGSSGNQIYWVSQDGNFGDPPTYTGGWAESTSLGDPAWYALTWMDCLFEEWGADSVTITGPRLLKEDGDLLLKEDGDAILLEFGQIDIDIDDNVAVADNLAKSASLSKTDTVTISDSIVKTLSLIKIETLAITDSIVKTFGLVKAETVNISDSISKATSIVKSDTMAIADSIVKAVSLIKADTVTIADTLTKAVGLVKAETVAIADSISKTINLAKSESVAITDAISKAISLIKADIMPITETMSAIIAGVGLAIHLFDTVVITDSLEGVLWTKTYLKQGIARMQIKGMNIARMSIKRMGIDRMPLFRWIIRRWTA